MAFVPPAGNGAAPKRGLGAGAIIGIIVGGFVLVMLMCGGVGLALLLPALGKARTAAHEAMTTAQARMLSQTLVMYAMDHKDALPASSTWTNDIAPIMGDPQTLAGAIDSKRIDGATPDYIYLPPAPLNGETHARLSDIANPSSYIIIHEDVTRLPARYNTVIVGMADGSVHMVGRDELKARLVKQAAAQATAGPQ